MMPETGFIDVKIFPQRLLKPETVEKILNRIYELEGIVRVLVHGPSIPDRVYYGPARGTEVNHSDRRKIKVRGEEVELRVKVGEIIVGILPEALEEKIETIEEILDEVLPCSYKVFIGAFTKKDITISDYLKYGLKFEEKIDPRVIGMVDPSSRMKDTVINIK
ncbi:methyl-coenzyme M reductase operon protein D [Methanothermobacter thermautotrophicus]|uniref:Methyl-coenzyme M reductase operon protein D n=1 Tax=Methanothermobacter thermautotrophicus TaxID=145262 RepID=A0A842YLM3_METTF|nr:methyl-coenzyme M reductase operon protein D [Methanothermobacter thermautotrophicus]MBE2900266.1 methyl-coenzyme M reductase operon protein D [Methanothermobacter thermautotrophicus]